VELNHRSQVCEALTGTGIRVAIAFHTSHQILYLKQFLKCKFRECWFPAGRLFECANSCHLVFARKRLDSATSPNRQLLMFSFDYFALKMRHHFMFAIRKITKLHIAKTKTEIAMMSCHHVLSTPPPVALPNPDAAPQQPP